MKKIITAILAVFYLTTSVGAVVHLHYCMGKVVNWGLWNTTNKKCSKCGMEKSHTNLKGGCCKDEQKQLKTEKDQKLAETVFNLIHVISATPQVAEIELPVINISSVTEINPISHAPPRSQVAIHIRNCVFLV